MTPETPTVSTPASGPILLTDWLLGGFRLLGPAIAHPSEWHRLTAENGLKSHASLADLRTELAESTLLVVVLVIQLAIACITTLALLGLLTLSAARLLEPQLQLLEALRPILLIMGVGLGFGAITVCALSVRAGVAVSVLAPAAASPLAVIALIAPNTRIAGYDILSATGEVRALGYTLGGFTAGVALALAERYLCADAAAPADASPPAPRGRTVFANLLLAFALLLSYTLAAYFILQAIPGKENASWVAMAFALLPLIGILYRQYQFEPRSTWKSYALSAAPTFILLTTCAGIFAVIYKHVDPPPGHWIDRLGVGLLAGALIAGALVFLSSLLAPLFPRPDQRWKAATITSAMLMAVWVCALAFGAFNDLNQENRFYTVYGAVAGALTIWLGSLVLIPLARVRIVTTILLTLSVVRYADARTERQVGRTVLQESPYVGYYELTGTSQVHAEAAVLWRRVNYDKTFTPDFTAIVTATNVPGRLLFTLTHKGQSQQLVGIVQANGTVTFPPRQQSPQKFEGDGFSADLVGTLREGTASLDKGTLRVRTSWTAKGTVYMGVLSRDVTGTIVNDLSGMRKRDRP